MNSSVESANSQLREMIIYTTKPDSSFLINEVNTFFELKQPLLVLYEIDRPIPAQIQDKAAFIFLPTHHHWSLFATWHFLFNHGIELFKVPFRDWLDAWKQGKLLDIFMRLINASLKLKHLRDDHSAAIQAHSTLLSFWFYDVSLPVLMKSTGIIERAYSRAHRGDIYEGETGVMPLILRRYFLKHIGGLFPISDDGTSFLRQRYPSYAQNIRTAHLGSRRYFNPNLEERPAGSPIAVVSCSWMNNKKRVHLIPSILAALNTPFHWYHFGSGPSEFETAVNEAIDAHGIREHCTLFGAKTNEEVQRFYAENHLDVFLSVSSTEGVPVSFMEAISYGIPVIATNVGGNREIVNEVTGKLCDVDAAPNAVAELVESVVESTDVQQRTSMIRYWEMHFDSKSLSKEILNWVLSKNAARLA